MKTAALTPEITSETAHNWDVLTQQELAERWGVANHTINQWRSDGKPLPKGFRPLGATYSRRWCFHLIDVITFENQQKNRIP